MKRLSDDYEISVGEMIDITKDKETDKFKIDKSEFYLIKEKKFVHMNVLRYDVSFSLAKQIFQMKDGNFILEVSTFDDEEGEIVEYYYSTDINELT